MARKRSKNGEAQANRNGEPLLVWVGLDGEGSVYILDPRSEDRVREAFPEARVLPKVFFGYKREEEFETLHGPLWPLAGTLLTGLTLEQIGQLGGVKFYLPRRDKVVWEWPPDGAIQQGPARDSSCSDTSASRAPSRSVPSA